LKIDQRPKRLDIDHEHRGIAGVPRAFLRTERRRLDRRRRKNARQHFEHESQARTFGAAER
jgi:hypothetical protein